MHRRYTGVPNAAEPIVYMPPNPSALNSLENGPWVLCSTSVFPILYIVVGGYSRLSDLYTATGSSGAENRGRREKERDRVRTIQGRRESVGCTGRTVPLFNRDQRNAVRRR